MNEKEREKMDEGDREGEDFFEERGVNVTEVGERVARRENDFLNLLPPAGAAVSLTIFHRVEGRGRKKEGWWLGGGRGRICGTGPERGVPS